MQDVFGVQSLTYGGFYVTGVEHEAQHSGKNLDQMFQDITDRISRSALSEPLRSYVNSHVKCVQYFDKTIFVFEVLGQGDPSHVGTRWPERQGTQVKDVTPDRMGALFDRFK
ncbi:hypothetical protein [Paracoccus sp. MKU1]|uniref:hypothetical protein n=1 Tax=Paracoccus sp. MKU1 TaxID=1745182 RepID=UPI00128F22B3